LPAVAHFNVDVMKSRRDLEQCYTKPNIVTALQNTNPRFTDAGAYDFLGLSTTFSCPQYGGA
jgi:hypothetical protein